VYEAAITPPPTFASRTILLKGWTIRKAKGGRGGAGRGKNKKKFMQGKIERKTFMHSK